MKSRTAWEVRDSLDELAELAVTAGAEVVGNGTQKLEAPAAGTRTQPRLHKAFVGDPAPTSLSLPDVAHGDPLAGFLDFGVYAPPDEAQPLPGPLPRLIERQSAMPDIEGREGRWWRAPVPVGGRPYIAERAPGRIGSGVMGQQNPRSVASVCDPEPQAWDLGVWELLPLALRRLPPGGL